MDIALQKLIERRNKLQQAYDDLIMAPASYNIQGSVSAQEQKLADIRKELDAIDRQIAAHLGSNGIQRSYPNYNN